MTVAAKGNGSIFIGGQTYSPAIVKLVLSASGLTPEWLIALDEHGVERCFNLLLHTGVVPKAKLVKPDFKLHGLGCVRITLEQLGKTCDQAIFIHDGSPRLAKMLSVCQRAFKQVFVFNLADALSEQTKAQGVTA